MTENEIESRSSGNECLYFIKVGVPKPKLKVILDDGTDQKE
jgi:hypothetical protein